MKTIYKISERVQVGIYDSYNTADIYSDKIVVVMPCVKWVGNTGGYDEDKRSIRNAKLVQKITKELDDGCENTAWSMIKHEIQEQQIAEYRPSDE